MVRSRDAYPRTDQEVAAFVADLGLDGIVDVHVHAMPDRLQRAVWAYFDALDDPPWPITYRDEADARLAHLAATGISAHTALAYAHKPGMLPWLNDHTLALAERHDAVIPTFTIYPDDDVDAQVESAIARGGQVVKVHTQVGRYRLSDPRLATAWAAIEQHRLVVLAHVTAVYGVDGGEPYCGIHHLAELLEAHPGLHVVVAHLGMPEFDATLALAEQAPDNVLLEPSMALHDGPRLRQEFTPRQLRRLSARSGQLVFGSDFPSIPHDIAAQVRGLAALELDDDRLRDVLAHTARGRLAAARPARLPS